MIRSNFENFNHLLLDIFGYLLPSDKILSGHKIIIPIAEFSIKGSDTSLADFSRYIDRVLPKMAFKSIIFVLVLFLTSTFAEEEIPTYECDQGPNIPWMCSLEGIKLTKTNSSFTPTAKNASLITSVYITDSYIPVLGEDICKEFPNTQHIWLSNIGVRKIEIDAFRLCKSLERLIINYNPLQMLSRNTFYFNENLELVDLSHNQLRELYYYIFDTNRKLEHLSVFNNALKEFDYYIVKNTPKLKSLNIASNDITNINEVWMIEDLRELKDISYNDNELNCARVVEINRAFKDAKVDVRIVSAGKQRFYKTSEVDGVTCLKDDIWVLAEQRRTATKLEI